MLTTEQLKARKLGIGGSDVSAILGLNPYKTAVDIYIEKTSRDTSQLENDAIEWGNRLEPVVAQAYADKNNVEVLTDNATYVKNGWMIANIDGLVNHPDGNYILEVKTGNWRQAERWGDPDCEEIPEEYLVQVAWYCEVLGLERADIAVLLGGNDYRQYTYKANERFQKKIAERCEYFWKEHVMKKISPEPKTDNDVKLLWPTSSVLSEVVATSEVESIVSEMIELSTSKKEIDKKINDIKTEVKIFMQDNEVLVSPMGTKLASYKSQINRRVDSKKLKEERPEVYDEFLKISSTRIFRQQL